MKPLIFVIVLLFVAITLALAVMHDPGYVLIARSPWTVEMPLTVFAVILALGFAGAYVLARAVIRLWNTPRDVALRRREQRVRRTREALVHGLTSLIEGNWEKAEKQLLADIGHSETSLVNYLAAAFVAQAQGKTEKRDEYLALGHQASPDHAVATGMAQAQLQIMTHQSERALATLSQLRTLEPGHPRILALLAQTYRELNDWESLANLIPEMRRKKALAPAEIDAFELEARRQLLMLALPSGASGVLKQAWNAVPQKLQHRPELVAIYAQHLIAQGAADESEVLLRTEIDQAWDEDLVQLYGRVESSDPGAQLDTAEEWLANRSDSAALLLTLGRLAGRNKLLDQARDYLEKSVLLRGPAEAHQELAELLDRRGEHQKALEHYRRALELCNGKGQPPWRSGGGRPPNPRRNSTTGVTHYGY